MQSLNIWEQYKYKVHQIDSSLPKRKSKWILVCSECQNERTASYCQAWNIIKGKSSGDCLKCVNKDQVPPKMSAWNKGLKGSSHKKSEEQSRKMKLIHSLGHSFITEQGKKKQSLAKIGKYEDKANNWQGGKTSERSYFYSRAEYKQIRNEIFTRDNYTCQICLVRGGKLEMDHIKEWCNYPQLRFEKTNLRTLCHDCHTKTDNYGCKALALKKKMVE